MAWRISLGYSDSISSPRTGVEAILTELGPENQNWRYAASSHIHQQYHTTIHQQYHATIHQQYHTTIHQHHHTTIHQQYHTTIHQQYHTTIHQQYHATMHQQYHTTIHQQYHTTIHQQYHTTIHQQEDSNRSAIDSDGGLSKAMAATIAATRARGNVSCVCEERRQQ
jgi:hypothetical protein